MCGLGVQAQYKELRGRDREGESCPNYGVKRIRVRTRPLEPFWETVRNGPLGPGKKRPYSSREEMHAVRIAEEMNEAMREIKEEIRRF